MLYHVRKHIPYSETNSVFRIPKQIPYSETNSVFRIPKQMKMSLLFMHTDTHSIRIIECLPNQSFPIFNFL